MSDGAIPWRDEEATAAMHELYGGRRTVGSDDDEFLRNGDGTGAVGETGGRPPIRPRSKSKDAKKQDKEKNKRFAAGPDAALEETQAAIDALVDGDAVVNPSPDAAENIDPNEVDDDIILSKEQIEGLIEGKLGLLAISLPKDINKLAAGEYGVSTELRRIYDLNPNHGPFYEHVGETNKLLPGLHVLINSCLAIRNEKIPEGSIVYKFPKNKNTPGAKGSKEAYRLLDPDEPKKDASFNVKDTSRLYVTFIHKETADALFRAYHNAINYDHKDVEYMARLSHWRGQQILRLTGQQKFLKDDDLLWTVKEQESMEVVVSSTIAVFGIKGGVEVLERINFSTLHEHLTDMFSGGQRTSQKKAEVSVKNYCDVVPGQANRRHLNGSRPAFLHTEEQIKERAKETFRDILAGINIFRNSRTPISRQLNKADWKKFLKPKKKPVLKQKTEDTPRDDDQGDGDDSDDEDGDGDNGGTSAKPLIKGTRNARGKGLAKASPAKPRGQKRKAEDVEEDNIDHINRKKDDDDEDSEPVKNFRANISRTSAKRTSRARIIISDDSDDAQNESHEEVWEPQPPTPSKKDKGKQPASGAPAKPRRSARHAAPKVPKAIREHNKKIARGAKDLERGGKAYLRSAKSRRGFDEGLFRKAKKTYLGKKASHALFPKYSLGDDEHTEETDAPPAYNPVAPVAGPSKRPASEFASSSSPRGPLTKRARECASPSAPLGSSSKRAKRASPPKPTSTS